MKCGVFGGDKRDRTADLLNAIQALSQLSYTPILLRLFPDDFCIIARIIEMSRSFLHFFEKLLIWIFGGFPV